MSDSSENADWTFAEGHTGDYPFLARIRQFPSGFPRSEYPKRLNVFWSMRLPDANGLATAQESKNLQNFEDRLVAAVEQDKSVWFVAAITGRSEREFVFYLLDPQLFMQRLTEMPQEQDRYPIEIHLEEDPEWSYFDGLAPTERHA
jgi:hypothetical protein